MPKRQNRTYKKTRKDKDSLKKMMKAVAYSTQETKHHRVLVLDGDVSESGSALELNSVDAQGVASGNFIGQEVRQVGLRLKGSFIQSDRSNIIRWLVCTFTESFSQLLAAGTAQFNNIFYDNTIPIYSPLRECNVMKVYLDRTVVLNQSDADNNKISLFNKWISLGFKKYKVNEDNLAGVGRGSDKIYLLSFSDSGLPFHPTITCHSTLYYKDA